MLRTAHDVTPRENRGSHLGAEPKSPDGATGLERRLQPARTSPRVIPANEILPAARLRRGAG